MTAWDEIMTCKYIMTWGDLVAKDGQSHGVRALKGRILRGSTTLLNLVVAHVRISSVAH